MEATDRTQTPSATTKPVDGSVRNAKIACWLIVAAFFATAIAVQFIVRLDWGPDEADHLQYIHALSEGRIPTVEETHQVQHGPVYYALMAGLWRAVGVEQAPAEVPRTIAGVGAMTDTGKLGRRVLRAASALLGCAVLIVLMAIMAALDTPWRWRPWLLLAAAASPVMHYLGGIVNNEMASILYSAIICLFIVRALKADRCSVRDAALLGLLVGGTLLVKRTGLFVAPVAIWAVWSLGDRSQRLQRIGAFALGAVVIGIWWPLYSRHATGGVLGTATVPQDQQPLSVLITSPLIFVSWVFVLLETALLPAWYWELILRLPVQIIGAVILALIVAVAIWGLSVRRDRFHFRLRALAVVSMATLLLGIMHYVAFADWRAHMQGRYLLSAIPWLICLFAGMRPIVESLGERFAEAAWWRHLRGMAGLFFVLSVIVFNSAWWFLAWEFYANIESRF